MNKINNILVTAETKLYFWIVLVVLLLDLFQLTHRKSD
jgi:hypothetical protein